MVKIKESFVDGKKVYFKTIMQAVVDPESKKTVKECLDKVMEDSADTVHSEGDSEFAGAVVESFDETIREEVRKRVDEIIGGGVVGPGETDLTEVNEKIEALQTDIEKYGGIVKGYIASSALDTLKSRLQCGVYAVTVDGTANTRTGTLIVGMDDMSTVQQYYFGNDYPGSMQAGGFNSNIYTRSYYYGTWGVWTLIAGKKIVTDIETLKTDTATIKADVETLKGDAEAQGQAVAELGNRVEANESVIAEVKETLENFAGSDDIGEATVAQVVANTAAIAEAKAKIGILETDAADTKTELTAVKNIANEAQRLAEENEADLENLGTALVNADAEITTEAVKMNLYAYDGNSKSVTIPAATKSVGGVMSAGDKTMLETHGMLVRGYVRRADIDSLNLPTSTGIYIINAIGRPTSSNQYGFLLVTSQYSGWIQQYYFGCLDPSDGWSGNASHTNIYSRIYYNGQWGEWKLAASNRFIDDMEALKVRISALEEAGGNNPETDASETVAELQDLKTKVAGLMQRVSGLESLMSNMFSLNGTELDITLPTV